MVRRKSLYQLKFRIPGISNSYIGLFFVTYARHFSHIA